MLAMPIPPAQATAAPVEAARPSDAQAAAPLLVDSHGFRYTVTGNTLLAPAEVTAALT